MRLLLCMGIFRTVHMRESAEIIIHFSSLLLIKSVDHDIFVKGHILLNLIQNLLD